MTITFARPQLAQTLRGAIENNPNVLLIGPANAGKSFLAMDSQARWRREGRGETARLDFYALRKQSIESLDREATRWLFCNREKAFQEFLARQRKRDPLLCNWIAENLPPGSLLILDHLEKLPDTPAINDWLSMLKRCLDAGKIHTLWIERTVSRDAGRIASAFPGNDFTPVCCDPFLPPEELKDWLDAHQEDAAFRQLDSTRIQTVSNGLVSLCHDYLSYAETSKSRNGDVEDRFWQVVRTFPRKECFLAVSALARHPEELDSFLVRPSPTLQRELLASGAYITDAKGKLIPACPVFRERLEQQLTANNLLAFSAPRDSAWLRTRGRSHGELVPLALTRSLLDADSDTTAIIGIHRFITGCYPLSHAAPIIRDEDHPLIWRQIRVGKNSLQTDANIILDRQTDSHKTWFDVMRSGRPARSTSGEWLVPLIDSKGRVSMFWSLRFSRRIREHPWQEQKLATTISLILESIQPAFRHHLVAYYASYATRYQKRFQQRVSGLPIKHQRGELDTIIKESGAQAVIVARPPPHGNDNPRNARWTVEAFEYSSRADGVPVFSEEYFAAIDSGMADYILRHPNQTGLVLRDQKAHDLFPSLKRVEGHATLFAKSVIIDGKKTDPEVWLAIFAYHQPVNRKARASGKILYNHKRQMLALLSQRLVEFTYWQAYWRKNANRELEFIRSLGGAMTDILSDPQKAALQAIESVKRYFNARDVAIALIDKMRHSGRLKAAVCPWVHTNRERNASIKPIPVEARQGERVASYIARARRTLVVNAGNDPGSPREVLYYDDSRHATRAIDDQSLSRFSREEFGESPDNAMIGVPILSQARHPEKNPPVLGVLTITFGANQTDRPSHRAIAEAHRLSGLLAPILYYRQQINQFNVADKQKTMSALLNGIEHELKHHLKDLRWGSELLKITTDNAERDELCDKMEQSVDRINQRLLDIRRLALADAGDPVKLPLRRSIARAVDDFRKKRGVKIPIAYADIPEEHTVTIDPAQFNLAIDNLLRNAARALENTKNARIEIYSDIDYNQMVEITIADNGPGVRRDLEDIIFDPFVSGQNNPVPTNKPDRARGIGLALVRTIAEAASGNIAYTRADNESRFRLTLPR